MQAEIPRIQAKDVDRQGLKLLEEAGCLVVTDICTTSQLDSLRAELAAPMSATSIAAADDPSDFYPGLTRRVTSLMATSETAREFVMHALPKTVCDHFLLPNCPAGSRYQLHVSAAVEVGPGARTGAPSRGRHGSFLPGPAP